MSCGLVRVMDHDCPWIGGCVGGGNHRAFVLMVFLGQVRPQNETFVAPHSRLRVSTRPLSRSASPHLTLARFALLHFQVGLPPKLAGRCDLVASSTHGGLATRWLRLVVCSCLGVAKPIGITGSTRGLLGCSRTAA